MEPISLFSFTRFRYALLIFPFAEPPGDEAAVEAVFKLGAVRVLQFSSGESVLVIRQKLIKLALQFIVRVERIAYFIFRFEDVIFSIFVDKFDWILL